MFWGLLIIFAPLIITLATFVLPKWIRFKKFKHDTVNCLQYEIDKRVKNVNIETCPTFSFKQIKQFYYLNPDSWKLLTVDNYPVPAKKVEIENGKERYVYVVETGKYKTEKEKDYTYIPVFFKTFIDQTKYINWVSKKIAKEQTDAIISEKNKNTKAVVELVQKDIDIIQEQAMKDLREQTELLTEKLTELKNQSVQIMPKQSEPQVMQVLNDNEMYVWDEANDQWILLETKVPMTPESCGILISKNSGWEIQPYGHT